MKKDYLEDEEISKVLRERKSSLHEVIDYSKNKSIEEIKNQFIFLPERSKEDKN